MITPQYARTMARYNRWMNGKLYECCAGLDDAVRKEDAGAFFRSIHGTLNHLLVADRVWMGRFLGAVFVPTSLAQELHADFGDLRREREKMDEAIVAYADTLTEAALASTLDYTSISKPAPQSKALGLCVVHFFNHQAHHRGQLTTLLMQRGVDPGVTDLIALPS